MKLLGKSVIQSNSFVAAAEQVRLEHVLEHRQRRSRCHIAWQAVPHLCRRILLTSVSVGVVHRTEDDNNTEKHTRHRSDMNVTRPSVIGTATVIVVTTALRNTGQARKHDQMSSKLKHTFSMTLVDSKSHHFVISKFLN